MISKMTQEFLSKNKSEQYKFVRSYINKHIKIRNEDNFYTE